MTGLGGRLWWTGLIATVAATVTTIGGAAGCSEPCCTTDGFPINLLPRTNTDEVGLVASAQGPTNQPFTISVDTGSALNLFGRQSGGAQIVLRDFDILDGQPPAGRVAPIVRGTFHQIEGLSTGLNPDGPGAVLGGTLLQNFSVQFEFAKPAVTFWARQGATDGFLDAAGFAVLHFNLLGGAELTVESRPDVLGLTGPLEVPPSRVVVRACGGPTPFDPDALEPERCCKRGDEVGLATGTNLALVVATGIGPLVLSQSAWNRVAAGQLTSPLTPPVPGATLLIPTLPAPLTNVSWSTLPRIALVNQELDDATNPGACVDLGRARRLEWIEHHQSEDGTTGACPLPCDTDPRDATKAQNAAAYVEFGENIPVAVLPDSTPLLQALRAEIRPEGPEIDGLIGANLFAQTTMEIDYRSKPGRAVIACAPGVVQTTCKSSPRCPRLVNPGDARACFGQPRRSLPLACDVSVCG